MILEDLVGPHELSGVEYGMVPREDNAGRTWEFDDDSNTMTFVLDGKAYCAIEDPSDGYRSCMRDIIEVPVADVKNRFAPVLCVATHLTQKDGGGQCDVLVVTDPDATKVYLEVGTDNSDDYYPSFVGYFDPKALAGAVPQPTTKLVDLVRRAGHWVDVK